MREFSGLDRDLLLQSGIRLLRLYGDSPSKAIMENYASHEWKPWRFKHTTASWWVKLGQQFLTGQPQAAKYVKEYISELEASVNIEKKADWLTVSLVGLKPTDRWRLRKLGGLNKVLAALYPEELPRGTMKVPGGRKETGIKTKQGESRGHARQTKSQVNIAKHLAAL